MNAHTSAGLDPRLTPARPDLAAAHLQGIVAADRYVEGTTYAVVRPAVPVRKEPDPTSPLTTEALFGETVTVYEIDIEGWAWGQLDADGYVGWLPAEAIDLPGAPATHKVRALRTPVFPGPSIKLPPMELLSFGSRLAIAGTRERFAVTETGGFVFADHLAPLDRQRGRFRRLSPRASSAPPISGAGAPASGWTARASCRCRSTPAASPRRATPTCRKRRWATPVAFSGDIAELQRGDLVYWPGHVGIVENADTLLHATAHFMSVVREPLKDALARIEALGTPVRSVKRL